MDVKNGANLLDHLLKDIVTESDTFHVDQFLPLLQKYTRRTNPYIRQLLAGWITVLDSVPDVNMIDYLPDVLDGLFNMLSEFQLGNLTGRRLGTLGLFKRGSSQQGLGIWAHGVHSGAAVQFQGTLVPFDSYFLVGQTHLHIG
eukprot:scaffold287642_cov47-Attheya_sp.AAC.1